METWRSIPDFPDYVVSSEGRVAHAETGRPMAINCNQFGIPHVGLTKDRVQHRRALAPLVAKAFIKNPNYHHDTPINLNGDRLDCRAVNLQWRARWFAIQFFKQLHAFKVPLVDEPIVDNAGNKYENSREAALAHGLLEWHIYESCQIGTYVPPSNLVFSLAN